MACASSPSTAAIELLPAGAASAIALPRSTTALITCGGRDRPRGRQCRVLADRVSRRRDG